MCTTATRVNGPVTKMAEAVLVDLRSTPIVTTIEAAVGAEAKYI